MLEFECLNSNSSLEETRVRDLEPAEQEIKAAMLTTAPQRVLEMVTELMRELLHKAQAKCSIPEPAAAEESKSAVPEEIQQAVRESMEEMRLNHLPSKFKQVDWTQPKVELSVARVTDVEMKEIIEALAGNEQISSLDLSHNELTDIGVQQLVTCMAMGGAPNLKELRIVKNKYEKMGQNMLAGLQAMRKNLKLTYDTES
eukprot:TRINITY_DN2194_c0_g2_i2.p1 TRINITY_DN2194_c0_g2~~TRINITY_DN2194_c0_g2_i2.p1  ORF type:complete len:200 (+),score=64.84 TRINITY_DN2194_c0_g2_i2:741-1340(+)